MSQDVTEHKVQVTKNRQEYGDGELPSKKVMTKGKGLELKSRTTKRAVGRILDIVQNKLRKLVSQKTEEPMTADEFHRAMTHPEVQEVVQKHILSENIQMQDPGTKKPVYKRHMSLIGEKGDRAAMESPGRDSSPGNSPRDEIEPEQAEIVADEAAVREISTTVDRLKRTNSLK